MHTTRTPTERDLPAILQLTRENRRLLAALEPDFWHKAVNADESHQSFVTFQLTNENLTKRVLERDGRVIGYAVSVMHPSDFYVVDDVCLAGDADWLTDGAYLLRSIEERPAIMTAPHGDSQRVEAAGAVGMELIISSHGYLRKPLKNLRFLARARDSCRDHALEVSVQKLCILDRH